MYGYDYPELQTSIYERNSIPRGYTAGAIIPDPQNGRTMLAISRNRDGKTVLVQITPSSDDEITAAELRQAIEEALPKNPAAVALGKLGGASKSPAKIAAVRVNGARGGITNRTRLTEAKMADHSGAWFLNVVAFVERHSKTGDPHQSLQDWLANGDYSTPRTIASVIAEWDAGR